MKITLLTTTKRRRGWIGLCLVALLALVAVDMARAQDAGAEAREAKGEQETLLSLLLKGGPVMFPLGLCSVAALALAVERGLSLRRHRIIPEGFIERLKTKLTGKPEDIQSAVQFCEESQSPVGNIFKAGILNLARGDAFVEKAIEDAGAREVDRLKRSLRGLSAIASISPLLGLLGTVYGMIGAFQSTITVGVNKSELLAKGIYEALVTTAAGLTIAIPVLLVYLYFNSRVDALVDEIDDLGLEFMEHSMANQLQQRPSS
jgi:biopolymer transport protein ExbB